VKGKYREQLYARETAPITGLRVIGKGFPVGGGVGHGYAGAINNPDQITMEEVFPVKSPLKKVKAIRKMASLKPLTSLGIGGIIGRYAPSSQGSKPG
jgi:hypothetical protein